MPRPVRGVLAVEGRQTGDGRFIVPDAVTWLDPPLPIAWAVNGDQHVMGIDEAPQVGVIQTVTRSGGDIAFTGIVDDGQEDGAEMVRRMEAETATFGPRFGLSIDPDDWEMQLVATHADDLEEVVVVASGRGPLPSFVAAAGDGDPIEEGDAEVVMEAAADDMIERYTRLRIRGVTALSVGAFAEAYMELAEAAAEEEPADTEEPEPEEDVISASAARTATAVRAGAPPLPSADHFERPEFTVDHPQMGWVVRRGFDSVPCARDTPGAIPAGVHPTVVGGRTFGHIAAFGTCHVGRTDVCLEPPPSECDYAHFLTSTSWAVRNGQQVRLRTGRITAGIGHADLNLDAFAAAAHYDNSDAIWAEVAAGHDEFGIWQAGVPLPDVDELKLRRVGGLPQSGDWRRKAGNLELIAALSVPVPGFPVGGLAASAAYSGPRVHIDEQGCLALVAAGMVRLVTETDRLRAQIASLTERLDSVERVTGPLTPLAVEQLAASIRPA